MPRKKAPKSSHGSRSRHAPADNPSAPAPSPPSNIPGAREHRAPLRLHGTIARELGILIVSGGYRPGDRLDDEVSAADRLQVSRGAYREAVRILAAKGLVESRPKVGTRVSEPGHWHLLDPDVLSWIFDGDPDEKLLFDLFELRDMIEPRAAALAAERRTARQLATMKRALDDMARHTLATEKGRRADQAFHGALLAASGNAFLVSLTSSVNAAIAWTTIFKQRSAPLPRDPMPDHVRVFETVRAGDREAAHVAMKNLVRLALLDTNDARSRKNARE